MPVSLILYCLFTIRLKNIRLTEKQKNLLFFGLKLLRLFVISLKNIRPVEKIKITLQLASFFFFSNDLGSLQRARFLNQPTQYIFIHLCDYICVYTYVCVFAYPKIYKLSYFQCISYTKIRINSFSNFLKCRNTYTRYSQKIIITYTLNIIF